MVIIEITARNVRFLGDKERTFRLCEHSAFVLILIVLLTMINGHSVKDMSIKIDFGALNICITTHSEPWAVSVNCCEVQCMYY